MAGSNELPRWAPKVPRAKILQLYTSDAAGILDEEQIDDVGWALWSRCDSILQVTEAHHGHVLCPACGAAVEHPAARPYTAGDNDPPWQEEDLLQCGVCGWNLVWKRYHQTFRGKQLFGANAVPVFAEYHRAFPKAAAPQAKMLLIDQLIHALHDGLNEPGRPVGANLIEGNLQEVIRFLDALTAGTLRGSGIDSAHTGWRETVARIPWARPLLPPADSEEPGPPG